MNSKSIKKFLKKNILLQQNLEKFLDWREKKNTQELSKYSLRNVSLNTCSKKNVKKKGKVTYLYRPISGKLPLDKMQHKRLLFSEFFPHKKPFMHFWIFPLLGGCFLSFLTFNQDMNSVKKVTWINSLNVPWTVQNNTGKDFSSWVEQLVYLQSNNIENSISFNNPAKSKAMNGNLAFFSNLDEVNYSKNSFSAHYTSTNSSSLNKNLNTQNLSKELETLCSFYLNLTLQKLQTSSENADVPKNTELFMQTVLPKNIYFQNQAQFNWTWHTLIMFPDSFFSDLASQKLAQKMSNENWSSHLKKQKEFFLPALKKEFINIPHLSYYQGCILLDQWLKLLEYNSAISMLANPNVSQHPNATLPESLDKMNALEMLLVKNKKNKNPLFFHFSNLLDMRTKNQNQLKQLYTKQQLRSLTGEKNKSSETFSFQLDLFNKKSTNLLSTNLLKQVQNQYRYTLIKMLFENYLQTKSHKKLKTTGIQPVVSNQKFKKVLNYTVFLNYMKQKSLLDTKTKPILKNLQSLALLNNVSNSLEFKFTETKLKNITYELLLLQYWKQYFPNLSNIQDCKKLPTFENSPSLDPPLEFSNILDFSLKVAENKKISKIFKPTPKLVKETHLYQRLNKISNKILEVSSSFSKKNIGFLEPFPNQAKIIQYKTPILMSNSQPLNLGFSSTNLKDAKSGENHRFFQTQTKSRSSLPWFEISSKQNELGNNFFFYKKPFSPMFKWETTVSNEKQFSNIPLFKTVIGDRNLKTLFSFQRIPTFDSFGTFFNPSQYYPKQAKTFSIVKPLNTLKNQKVILLKRSNCLELTGSKNPLKYFKQKTKLNSQFSPSLFEKRKPEKIFRTYFSVKFSENNQKNIFNRQASKLYSSLKKEKKTLTSAQEVLPILEKIKQNVKFKRLLTKQSAKIRFLNSSTTNSSLGNLKQKTFSEFSSKPLIHKFALDFAPPNLNPVQMKVSKALVKKLGGNLLFLKKADFSLNEMEIKRLERKKALQKKRRLKKLKLENRRRKKRKRFYPRPNHLRFHLYESFLQKRHPQLYLNHFSKKHESNIIKSQDIIQSQLVSKKRKAKFFTQKIYRQQNQKWGNVSSNLLILEKFSLKKVSLNWLVPTYHQQEFYKISNETLTEFERLCWKSYWLRSNLTPYIRRIQQNLKKMQENENVKNSQKTFSTVLENLFTWPVSKKEASFDSSRPQFLSKEMKRVPAYLNIKETLENSFLKNPSFSNFKHLENKAEYNRLIYERITDEIKNVKSQLNVDGQNHARSYKLGRQKIEKAMSKNMGSSLNSWMSSFLEPRVQSFPILAATQDSSIKPFGDLPTLRLLWACHKTNLFTYHQNNLARNLWSTYKNREQTKNNKTKKFLSKLFKFSNFSPKTMETMSIHKTKLASKKIQFLGGFIYGKNYHIYLRNLKYSLQELKSQKLNKVQTRENFRNSSQSTLLKPGKSDKNWFSTNLGQKPQKRMVHFWWSTQQLNPIEQIFSLWVSSPFVYNDLNFYVGDNKNSLLDQTFAQSNPNNPTVQAPNANMEINQNFMVTTFWVCCLLFHVSIFFAVIRIPEIRSLAKFQFLLLSKLVNAYLMGLFSIYDLLVDYKTKIDSLIQKTRQFSKLGLQTSNSWDLLSDYKKNMQHTSNYKKQFSNQSVPIKVLEDSSKPVVHSLIHSTMSFTFDFRSFMNSSLISESKPLEVINKEALHAVLVYSINPSANKYNSLNKTKNSQSNMAENWFYSWYTGFLWYTFSKSVKNGNLNKNQSFKSFFSTKKQTYVKEYVPSLLGENSTPVNLKKTYKTSKQTFSLLGQSNIQLQSILSLFTLYLTKLFVNIFYVCFNLFYQFLFKLIDLMEGILMIFYKFLEKPAELMVEWIAEIFLIEWSSDLTTYVPEAFDTSIWNSTTKFSRSTKPFGGFIFGFITQKIFLGSFEIFYSWILKPDTDLMMRQKKGVIFWDIWAEILIQAAEKYKMNLSSLSTLKEEQELLIENLLEDKGSSIDKNSLPSLQSSKSKVTSTHFLNSETFKASLTKMTPLMKFLQTSPIRPGFKILYSSSLKFETLKNNPYKFFHSNFQLSNLSRLKIETESSSNVQQNLTGIDSWKRWSVNQSLTTQGRDTDLFMDIHPPKSFLNISFLKTYLPAQEILGSLVCDIYSGLFTHKVSKNILVVGAPGTAKSFFIQALAGETELKIVTDNAHRYALVQGGVPVGMKLLRDVFDSIALHTPCLFLLEDIHIIGERRPMLISDDENSKASDSVFGAEQEEVHEKNRLIYQLSRHSISHYKRPYKGDFSLSIPTNHFCYDLFLGISPPRKRRSGLTVKSPLPLVQLEKALTTTESSTANKEKSSSFSENKSGFNQQTFLSLLQVSTEQVFAPPATSPFTILLMKEQKKLKPKKFVKEIPWSGLSYDQYMLISKSHYSVRVKVALLAEMAMNNLSVKLDMITDLLVIIDSVRSNRGFVVFATTHVPSLLDPALRRPGRLDETISLPLLPNLMSRFEIFKTNLASYAEATDLLDYSLLTSAMKQNENQIYAAISKSLLLLLNTKNSKKFNLASNLTKPLVYPNFYNDYPIYSISQAFQTSMNLNASLINTTQLQKCLTQASKSESTHLLTLPSTNSNLSLLLQRNPSNVVLEGNDKLNYISLTYAQAGQFLVEALILKDQGTYACKFLTSQNRNQEAYNTEEQIYKTLYNSNVESKNTLLKLFAGKISEFFVLNTSNSQKFIQYNFIVNSFSQNQNKTNLSMLNQTFSSGDKKSLVTKDWWLSESSLLQTNPSQSVLFDNIQNYQTYWQAATSFLESLYQKRFLYNKNTIVSKMLFFEDGSSLREPPSPPNSSILMPAKKFETYKRSLKDFIQKPMLTITEKIQLHQKQRFLKQLYNVSVQTSFKTASNTKNSLQNAAQTQSTNFYNSFKELGYLDLMTLKPTSTYCFYKNRFLTRHRFSFLNQWWNGQLAEHNVETTYLSHVDWRSMFVQSLGDLVIDFPDAEQYYNPRLRRWFLQSTSWNYWLSFDKSLKQEISQHYILFCFTKTSNLLNSNRELFDYLAYRFLRYHQLKEMDLLDILIRFYKTKEIISLEL